MGALHISQPSLLPNTNKVISFFSLFCCKSHFASHRVQLLLQVRVAMGNLG